MPSYYTYDYLPDLTPTEMAEARRLNLAKTEGSYSWENEALFASAEDFALLHDTFVFYGLEGATYDIVSSSYFDPFILLAYDNLGNVIAVDDGKLDYGYDHIAFKAPYTGIYYFSASWNQGSASTNKMVGAGVFEELSTIVPARPKNIVTGTIGNDRLLGSADDDAVDGGSGVDTFVLGRQREMYSVVKDGATITVKDVQNLSGVDTLVGIERIQFFGGNYLSFETEGIPAQAYRLYQAAFGRTPDKGGLGYWIGQMGKGASLQDVALAFTSSVEFKTLYGSAPSNSDILAGVYKNVLHRTPDQDGFAFWLKALDSKASSVTDMLVAFSESNENQVQVIGALQAGFEYTVT